MYRNESGPKEYEYQQGIKERSRQGFREKEKKVRKDDGMEEDGRHHQRRSRTTLTTLILTTVNLGQRPFLSKRCQAAGATGMSREFRETLPMKTLPAQSLRMAKRRCEPGTPKPQGWGQMVALCQGVRVSLRVSRLAFHPLMYARHRGSLPALNNQGWRRWGVECDWCGP
jgi:hypothetical protein